VDTKKSNSNTLLIFLSLVILCIGLFFADLLLGSVKIPFNDILTILSGNEPERSTWTAIIMKFRLPKAITALLAGLALSISGLQMQTLFRNPLAGPFVLGVSSGASLGVALVVLATGLLNVSFISTSLFENTSTIISASLGSFGVLALIIGVMKKIKDNVTLLIVGLMFSYLTGAIVSILMYFSTAEELEAFVIWGFGSFGGVTWSQLYLLFPIIIIGSLICFSLVKPLNALLLGENYAKSLGLNVERAKFLMICSTGLLAGSITAFCGPIAFLGIAIPHLARMITKTSNHIILVPVTALTGISIALLCDIISQVPGSQHALPINAVTSIIGAPIVIWVILRMKRIN